MYIRIYKRIYQERHRVKKGRRRDINIKAYILPKGRGSNNYWLRLREGFSGHTL